MTLLQAIVMGLVQGLTEFLPISSSGHLYLVPVLSGWKDPGAGFTAVIQLGTILAVFLYFGRDLGRVFMGWLKGLRGGEAARTHEARMGWAIALGTVPIAAAGLAFEKSIDSNLRTPWVVGAALIGFALVMGLAERVGRQERKWEDLTLRDGLVMGLWQCLALVPGSSRSGCTITGGLFGGIDRATAARFSFLLSVPAILASGLYKLYKERADLLGSGLMPTLVATVVAFASGYAAIAFLMKFLQSRSTWVFVWYRVALGVVILGMAFSGRLGGV